MDWDIRLMTRSKTLETEIILFMSEKIPLDRETDKLLNRISNLKIWRRWRELTNSFQLKSTSLNKEETTCKLSSKEPSLLTQEKWIMLELNGNDKLMNMSTQSEREMKKSDNWRRQFMTTNRNLMMREEHWRSELMSLLVRWLNSRIDLLFWMKLNSKEINFKLILRNTKNQEINSIKILRTWRKNMNHWDIKINSISISFLKNEKQLNLFLKHEKLQLLSLLLPLKDLRLIEMNSNKSLILWMISLRLWRM